MNENNTCLNRSRNDDNNVKLKWKLDESSRSAYNLQV